MKRETYEALQDLRDEILVWRADYLELIKEAVVNEEGICRDAKVYVGYVEACESMSELIRGKIKYVEIEDD